MTDRISQAIEHCVRAEMQEVVAKIIEEGTKQLQDEMSRKMDAMALKVLQVYSVEKIEQKIIITVHKPEDFFKDG